jgi:outer membrane protein OmpA-like peptidoglycan-associated protein
MAQNMVPDSSFENNAAIPADFSAIGLSSSWSRASWGTTDLFCKCEKKGKKLSIVGVPQNPMGYQEAHSGTCYAGIFALSHGYYREYLQTPLQQPLVKGKSYLFTMYVSLADYSRAAVDQLGVCFLKEKTEYNSSNTIPDTHPFYINIEKKVGKDTAEWHRVSLIYKAQGGESYLLIGAFTVQHIMKTKFKFPKELRSRINQKAERDAYYFIDDVSLVETIVPEPPALPSGFIVTDSTSSDSSFVFRNILFLTNETSLLPSSCPALDSLAVYLQKNPPYFIKVIGHTDDSGTKAANKKLSAGRAKTVADYLISKGITRNRISYMGLGSTKPLASNETEEGRSWNRRVEFVLTKE